MEISNIDILATLLNKRYVLPAEEQHLLVEENETDTFDKFKSCAEVVLLNENVTYLTCRFDDKTSNPEKPELFPYFSEVKSLKKNCDFVIFAHKGGVFYILLIELKLFNPNNKPQEQLFVSESFVNFMIERFSSIGYVFAERPVIRFIGIRDTQVHPIPHVRYTKPRDIVYDKNHYAEICIDGKKRHIPLRLDALLK